MTANDPIDVADAIKSLRKSKQLTQTEFAKSLGVTLSTVAKWETRKVSPSPMALLAIGRHDPENTAFWANKAGALHSSVQRMVDNYKKVYTVEKDDNRVIDIHGDAIAFPYQFLPEDAETRVSMPRGWFPDGATVVGIRYTGHCMAPLVQSGDVVFVALHSVERLEAHTDQMIAIAEHGRLCVGWLKKVGRSFFLISNDPMGTDLTEIKEGSRTILGRVVKWVSEPRVNTKQAAN